MNKKFVYQVGNNKKVQVLEVKNICLVNNFTNYWFRKELLIIARIKKKIDVYRVKFWQF